MRLSDPDICWAVLDSLEMGVYVVDRERRIIFWNRGAEAMTGFRAEEVLGRSCHEEILVHCDKDGAKLCSAGCPMQTSIEDGEPREQLLFLRHKAGHHIPVRVRITVLRNRAGEIAGGVETFVETPLERPLVSMAAERRSAPGSREHIERCLERNLSDPGRRQQGFGVLELRVDQIEQLRRTHGREAAETLLGVVAETLVNALPASDAVGRWSENEFLVIARESSARGLELDADRLRGMARSAEFRWWGDRVPVTVSVGGAIASGEDTCESLLRRAQAALEESSAAGGDRVTVANGTESGARACSR